MQLVSSPSAQRNVARFAKQAIQRAQKLAGALNMFRLGLGDGLALMARYNALERLSDHALAKRGLTRDDIAQAALDKRARGK
jgi:uncharacterized protein YjiS (DUF1127 family)